MPWATGRSGFNVVVGDKHYTAAGEGLRVAKAMTLDARAPPENITGSAMPALFRQLARTLPVSALDVHFPPSATLFSFHFSLSCFTIVHDAERQACGVQSACCCALNLSPLANLRSHRSILQAGQQQQQQSFEMTGIQNGASSPTPAAGNGNGSAGVMENFYSQVRCTSLFPRPRPRA